MSLRRRLRLRRGDRRARLRLGLRRGLGRRVVDEPAGRFGCRRGAPIGRGGDLDTQRRVGLSRSGRWRRDLGRLLLGRDYGGSRVSACLHSARGEGRPEGQRGGSAGSHEAESGCHHGHRGEPPSDTGRCRLLRHRLGVRAEARQHVDRRQDERRRRRGIFPRRPPGAFDGVERVGAGRCEDGELPVEDPATDGTLRHDAGISNVPDGRGHVTARDARPALRMRAAVRYHGARGWRGSAPAGLVLCVNLRPESLLCRLQANS
jgi:hypothetical protein